MSSAVSNYRHVLKLSDFKLEVQDVNVRSKIQGALAKAQSDITQRLAAIRDFQRSVSSLNAAQARGHDFAWTAKIHQGAIETRHPNFASSFDDIVEWCKFLGMQSDRLTKHVYDEINAEFRKYTGVIKDLTNVAKTHKDKPTEDPDLQEFLDAPTVPRSVHISVCIQFLVKLLQHMKTCHMDSLCLSAEDHRGMTQALDEGKFVANLVCLHMAVRKDSPAYAAGVLQAVLERGSGLPPALFARVKGIASRADVAAQESKETP